MLWYADWCPFSRIFLPDFEAAEPEANVPFARANLRHPLDPRWDDHGIRVVPTLAYYEKGEELERVESLRGRGLDKSDLEDVLDTLEALDEATMRRPRPKKRRPSARWP